MGKTTNECGCKNCGGNNTFGMSRVVGYYSIIENWNDSKKAELADRQKGSYSICENISEMSSLSQSQEEAMVVIR